MRFPVAFQTDRERERATIQLDVVNVVIRFWLVYKFGISNTMLTFESDTSFHGSTDSGILGSEMGDLVAGLNSIATNEEYQNDDGWGVVSMSPSNESGESLRNHGILIVDGVDSSIGIPSELSIPTDLPSLPTDLDDLHSEGNTEETAVAHFSKKKVCLALFLVLAMTSGAGIWLINNERNFWRSSTELLELEIQRLEEESIRLKAMLESTSFNQDQPEDSFKILDNCWVRADVKLGLCAQDTKEYINDLLFGSLGSTSGHSAPTQSNPTSENSITSIPLDGGATLSAATKKVVSTVPEIREDDQEGATIECGDIERAASYLSDTSLKLGEAMATAGDAISSEVREASIDTWTYLADTARDAMQDASYTAKPGRVGKQGLIDAASSVASSWFAFSDAMEAVESAVSDRIYQVMKDPLSLMEGRA